MPTDTFSDFRDSPLAPARDCFAITPSDTDTLAVIPKAIFVGVGGDIELRAIDSETDVTFRNVPAGATLDIRVAAIRATGTSADGFVGLA